MPKSIYKMTIAELAERGWIIIHDNDTGEPTSIKSVIDQWSKLAWAKQTYYRAKYGFDEDGVLEIRLFDLRPTPRITFRSRCDLFPDEFITPGGSMPGSNDRLRAILERSRVGVEGSNYDDTALAHTGPDNTLVLSQSCFRW